MGGMLAFLLKVSLAAAVVAEDRQTISFLGHMKEVMIVSLFG